MKIILTPITDKGKKVLKEHVDTTRLRDKVIMHGLGIKQSLSGDELHIFIDNFAIRLLQKKKPEMLADYMKNEQYRLIDDIEKKGIKKDIDFVATVNL